jgi:hypothetical protein
VLMLKLTAMMSTEAPRLQQLACVVRIPVHDAYSTFRLKCRFR